jgi:phosphohistidine swiveling domain-containing protein
VDLEIRWPSGIKQSFKAVASNRLVTVDEIKGIVETPKEHECVGKPG